MTREHRTLLLRLASDYGDSLARMTAEKELQKTLAARAQSECAVKPPRFVRLATALHKERVAEEREDLEALSDLFAMALGDSD